MLESYLLIFLVRLIQLNYNYVLLKRLIDLHVNSNLVLWIRDFLRDRPQHVCVNGYLSEEVVLNSGARPFTHVVFYIYILTI